LALQLYYGLHKSPTNEEPKVKKKVKSILNAKEPFGKNKRKTRQHGDSAVLNFL